MLIPEYSNNPTFKSLSDFKNAGQPLSSEIMVAVKTAKVLYANYQLLLNDFEDHISNSISIDTTQELTDEEKLKTDAWLIKNLAFISKPQAFQTAVNTKVSVLNEEREAFRPPRYGRAAVMPVNTFDDQDKLALFDVKGCGVLGAPPFLVKPVLPYANGLLTFEEAAYEVVYAQLVNLCLRHSNVNAFPLPNYAIIDLGFFAVFGDEKPRQKAVLLVRRANRRPAFQSGFADPGSDIAQRLLEVEMNLRKYGISSSSCGAIRFHIESENDNFSISRDGKKLNIDPEALKHIKDSFYLKKSSNVIDGVNIQTDDHILNENQYFQIIDFGRYRMMNAFQNTVFSSWHHDFEKLCGDFIHPIDDGFVQPDQKLSLSDIFESNVGKKMKRLIKQNNEGYEVDRGQFTLAIDNLIDSAKKKLFPGAFVKKSL